MSQDWHGIAFPTLQISVSSTWKQTYKKKKKKGKKKAVAKKQKFRRHTVCQMPDCNNPIPEGTKANTRYCSPECKIAAVRNSRWRYDGKVVRDLWEPFTLPCATCSRGKPNDQSESGWECAASLFLACRPFSTSGGTHYEPGNRPTK